MQFRNGAGGRTVGSALVIVAGLGLAAYLFVATGPAAIIGLLVDAGWGVAVVIAFHLSQVLFDALAWQMLLAGTGRPGLSRFMVLRWIREAVNNLLPVAQIGGEVVTARLLSLSGIGMAEAAAGTAIDLTMEMLAQVAFTVIGLIVLTGFEADSGQLRDAVVYAIIVLAALGSVFVAAQWAGLFHLVERALLRLGRHFEWAAIAEVTGLHRAAIDTWRAPGPVFACGALHLFSWLLGGVEVVLACHCLGHDVSLRQGIVLESISQAMKSVGFAVPGGLGIQEGGLVLLAPLCGLPASAAMALSLLKRLREVVLGVPALVALPRIAARAGVPAPQVEVVSRCR